MINFAKGPGLVWNWRKTADEAYAVKTVSVKEVRYGFDLFVVDRIADAVYFRLLNQLDKPSSL